MGSISQFDLNTFAKELNRTISIPLKWHEHSSLDEETWPEPNKYYWVIGITQNLDMELQWACEKRKFTTYGDIWHKYDDWTDMRWGERIFEAFWWAEIKEE